MIAKLITMILEKYELDSALHAVVFSLFKFLLGKNLVKTS